MNAGIVTRKDIGATSAETEDQVVAEAAAVVAEISDLAPAQEEEEVAPTREDPTVEATAIIVETTEEGILALPNAEEIAMMVAQTRSKRADASGAKRGATLDVTAPRSPAAEAADSVAAATTAVPADATTVEIVHALMSVATIDAGDRHPALLPVETQGHLLDVTIETTDLPATIVNER